MAEEQYLTITPAGSLFAEQCTAVGHDHLNPDIPLRITCSSHHVDYVWCGYCGYIWCPGLPGRNNGHQGTVTP